MPLIIFKHIRIIALCFSVGFTQAEHARNDTRRVPIRYPLAFIPVRRFRCRVSYQARNLNKYVSLLLCTRHDVNEPPPAVSVAPFPTSRRRFQ